MKVSILGCGEVSNIWKHGKLTEKSAKKLISDVGALLAGMKAELVVVPARGVPYEVAKAYRAAGGKKVTGIVPRDDTRYGIMHMEHFMDAHTKEENAGTWYDLNGEIAAKGDAAVCIGFSSGALLDMLFLKYHYKYLGSKTKLIVFSNTTSACLPAEVEKEIKPVYVTSVEELRKELEKGAKRD